MPRKRTQKIYFGEDQEKAVVQYLKSEDEDERNKIFNEFLREPLIIMVESIIRRYKLYRKDMEFDEIHTDTMSFLITKINIMMMIQGKIYGIIMHPINLKMLCLRHPKRN
jgi:hypothetical protein